MIGRNDLLESLPPDLRNLSESELDKAILIAQSNHRAVSSRLGDLRNAYEVRRFIDSKLPMVQFLTPEASAAEPRTEAGSESRTESQSVAMGENSELEIAKALREQSRLKYLEAQQRVERLEKDRPLKHPLDVYVAAVESANRCLDEKLVTRPEYLSEQDRLIKSLISAIERRNREPRQMVATMHSRTMEVESPTSSRIAEAFVSVAETLKMLAAETTQSRKGDVDQAAVTV